MHWGYSSKPQLFGRTEFSDQSDNDLTLEKRPINVILRLSHQTSDSKKQLATFCKLEDDQITMDKERMEYSSFDRAFSSEASQEDIFNYLNSDLQVIRNVLDAFNTTIITYGQELSGKTYTLKGACNSDGKANGIVFRLCSELFTNIEKEQSEQQVKFSVNLSAFELNMDKIYDLLNPTGYKKPLKIHHEGGKKEYSIKELTNTLVTSTDEIIKELTIISQKIQKDSEAVGRSKSHIFLKILVEQRNITEEVVKISSLNIIDLAGSNTLNKEKNNDMGSEEIKKLNCEMNSLKNMINTLSEYETKHGIIMADNLIPYKESILTKLLIDSLAGNSITTFIICCSTDKNNERDSARSLITGSILKGIKTSIHPNIFGLHQKKKMTMLVENMKMKEENYLFRIKQLEEERNKLRSESYETVKPNPDSLKEKLKQSETENKALLEQLELLNSLLRSSSDHGINSIPNNDYMSDITNTLIVKSSKVIELQISLEETKHRNFRMMETVKELHSKDINLEQMNYKLVSQIKSHEKAIQDLLTVNAAIQSELDNSREINKVRNEKVRLLEERVSKLNLTNSEFAGNTLPPRHRSTGPPGHAMMQIDEEKGSSKVSSWGFSHSKNGLWGMKKASTGSIAASNSEDMFVPRPLKKGLQLNSVRIFSGPETNSQVKK